MREIKNGMKQLFTTIFCLLMNLIPGKKFWTKEKSTDVDKKRVMSEKIDKRRKALACAGSLVNDGKNLVFHYGTGDSYSRYIQYLREYIECLDKHKSSCGCSIIRYEKKEFDDTG